MIKVLLADDHPGFRTGIRTILERNGGFEVVGEAETGRQAIEMERTLFPDILLLDMELPDVQGDAVTSAIVESESAVRILPLSGHTEMAYVLAALEAGAHGYASKDEPIDSLMRAIRLVAGGGIYLSPKIAASIQKWRSQLDTYSGTSSSACELLFRRGVSPRMLEILRAVADGQDDASIAERLELSAHTVHNHVAHLRELLDVPRRPALVAWYWRNGIQDLDPEYYALWCRER